MQIFKKSNWFILKQKGVHVSRVVNAVPKRRRCNVMESQVPNALISSFGRIRFPFNFCSSHKNSLTWDILVSIGIKRKQRLQTFA